MFHHLESAEKPAVLRELRRVLRPGGSLHIVDFGGAGHGLGALLARTCTARRACGRTPTKRWRS